MAVNRQRSDHISRLVQTVVSDAARRNRKIETVDPILRAGKTLFPTMPHRELLEYSQTALRIILTEPQTPTHQTTLLAHM
ncbi:hypothetical protein E2P71_05100 [Candidatus Bathyarchaeota archaeon]|nr:hypothetical protein E2P71_05100 [Candidatus Bathyarchaeota archaeon]